MNVSYIYFYNYGSTTEPCTCQATFKPNDTSAVTTIFRNASTFAKAELEVNKAIALGSKNPPPPAKVVELKV
jgi:hypothetical protein